MPKLFTLQHSPRATDWGFGDACPRDAASRNNQYILHADFFRHLEIYSFARGRIR